ncbi:MAG: ATP-grasp fold amidoligase family protein, partial [Verrucomicrobiota bacterium]
MKELAMTLIRTAPLDRELTEKILFFGKMGYWPNFDNPRTYNEKVNWRKLRSTNERYVQCADKIAVRDYVSDKIGEDYLVPLLYSGDAISPEQLLSYGDDIVIKGNHDSGSACVIRKNSLEASTEACRNIEKSLATNYGAKTNEWWYARIQPQVCVERLILNEESELAFDFKFFVFQQGDDEDPKIFIEVDFDRNTDNHHRGFYTSDRQPVDAYEHDIVIDDIPNPRRPFPEVENYEEMLRLVRILADEFDHVRVDFYAAAGQLYFGEMTFSEGGGRSRWSPAEFDRHLGECWNLDRRTGGPE